MTHHPKEPFTTLGEMLADDFNVKIVKYANGDPLRCAALMIFTMTDKNDINTEARRYIERDIRQHDLADSIPDLRKGMSTMTPATRESVVQIIAQHVSSLNADKQRLIIFNAQLPEKEHYKLDRAATNKFIEQLKTAPVRQNRPRR